MYLPSVIGKKWLQSEKTKDAIRLVLFAILGLTNCQYMYLTAIAYSNAGTATVLQYLGPALIMIISCVMGRRLPSKKELGAILLAITGTFLLATHGNPGTLVISKEGLFLGTEFRSRTGTLYNAARKFN